MIADTVRAVTLAVAVAGCSGGTDTPAADGAAANVHVATPAADPNGKADPSPEPAPEPNGREPNGAGEVDEPIDAPRSIDDAIEAPLVATPARVAPPKALRWKALATAKHADFPADAGAIVSTDSGTFTRGEDGAMHSVPALVEPKDLSPAALAPEPEPEPNGDDDEGEDDAADLVMRVDYEGFEGRWPDNLWYVKNLEDGRRGYETRLWQWSGQAWIEAGPTIPKGAPLTAIGNSVSALSGALDRRWSPRGGYVLAYNSEEVREEGQPLEYGMYRVGSRAGAPALPKHQVDGFPLSLVETRAGTTFVFARTRGDRLEISRSCRSAKPNCGYAPRFQAPAETCERFPMPVARGQHSMSAILRCSDPSDADLLVHYGLGGWSFERPPAGQHVHQIVADGSALWAVIQAEKNAQGVTKGEVTLWHRSGGGEWTSRSLPGQGPHTMVPRIRPIGEEQLWLLVEEGGDVHLYEAVPTGAGK